MYFVQTLTGLQGMASYLAKVLIYVSNMKTIRLLPPLEEDFIFIFVIQ